MKIIENIKKLKKYSNMLKGGVISFARFYYIYNSHRRGKLLRDKVIWFYHKKYEASFGIRTNTSDAAMFWAICLAGEYEIPWNKRFCPKVIIDAGCNVGYFSMIMTRKFPDALIISIEPDEDNYRMMEKNFNSLGTHNIHSILGAIWKSDTTLNVKNDGDAMGFQVEETKGVGKVKAFCVDTIMKREKIDAIDLFKIDIEGSEYELFFENFTAWIDKPMCYIVEPHDYIKDGTTDILKERLEIENGYCSVQHGEDIIFFRTGVINHKQLR